LKKELLRAEFVTKTLDQNNRLTSCNLLIYSGEIHGLMGANNSGKSLLLQTICGKIPGCEGVFYLFGRRSHFFHNMEEARRSGILYIKDVALIAQWSILENIMLWPDLSGRSRLFPNKHQKESALFWLKNLCCDSLLEKPSLPLSSYEKLKIHLVKAMYQNAKLIILDYPLAQFNYRQIEELKQIITRINESGVSVLITDYEYNRLMPIADSVTIMRKGRTIARLLKSSIPEYGISNQRIEQNDSLPSLKNQDSMQEMLYVDNLSGADISGFTLRIPKGRIVSFIDNIGNSNVQFGQLLCGKAKIDAGTIMVDGQPTSLRGKESARKNGIYWLAPTNMQNLLFEYLSVKDNLLMPVLKNFSGQFGIMNKGKLQMLFDTLCEDIFSIDTMLHKWNLASISEQEYRMLLLYRQAIMKPKVMVLFNFFSKMDTNSMINMKKPLKRFVETGSVVINITMNPEEALLLSDYSYFTNNKGIISILE